MTNESQHAENKMGVMPVGKLLVNMSLPMVISMLIQALYNIIDSAFVAQINQSALSAVSLAFPVQNLMIAVAAGTGVGINALLSRNLGEKKFEEANKVANNAILLTGLNYVIFLIFGLFFSGRFFEIMSKNPETVRMGSSYLFICCTLSFGIFAQITFERLMQSTGRTIYNMFTQGLGAIINIILDPILIFGLFGMPALGVTGAAVATVTGQIISMLLSVYFNHKKNPEIRLSPKYMKLDGRIVKQIYAVGLPSIIMQSISSVMTQGMNFILLTFSETAVNVFGIYFKLQSFIFMPIFGLNNGMVPIIAYNFGARNKDRITKCIKYSVITAMSFMFFGLIVFQLLPKQLLMIFKADEELLKLGVPALRIISISFIFAGFCIVCSSVFQALGNGVYSLVVSIARQLLVILPVAYLFAMTLGVHAVWWAIPIAEIVSVILSSFFLRKIYKQRLKSL